MKMFVSHTVDPDLGVEKEGIQNKETLIFKWEVEAPVTH